MSIPSGRALLDSERLLKDAGLKQNMRYADFGSGSIGHFVFPASAIVGSEGNVYAVDVLRSALGAIDGRSKMENVNNITSVWGNFETKNGVRLEEGSLDLISFINVTSHLIRTSVVIGEVNRLLNKNGRVLVVGWCKDSGSMIVPSDSRISKEVVKEYFINANFIEIKDFKAGPQHWGLVFKLEA